MELQMLLGFKKEELPEAANKLNADEIGFLVQMLKEKDDTIRYPSSLLLQYRSEIKDDVYPYWPIFLGLLESENAYHRSIGLILLARNAKWDKEGKTEAAFDQYLSFCDDEKPVVVRLCIQSLGEILPYKPGLHEKAVKKLAAIDLKTRKDTQRRLVLKDIIDVFLRIRNGVCKDTIDAYIWHALNGALLNKKEKEEIQRKMGE